MNIAMQKILSIFLVSLLSVSCSANEPGDYESLVECLMENLSSVEIERIAYLGNLDDPAAKIRDLERYLRITAKEYCSENNQNELAYGIKEVITLIRLRSMSIVLEKSNSALKKTFDSLNLSEEITLDCSSLLGEVVESFNSVLDERYVIRVTEKYSELRVTGDRIVTGSKIGLIMMQLSFIYGFEYYVTPSKEVVIVPIRGGLFL
jgi:hypothetical protein